MSPFLTRLLRAVLLRAGLVLLGIVVGVAMLEVGLRIFDSDHLVASRREKDMFCEFDRELGWAPLPNVTAVHRKDQHFGVVHQNQYGLRGPDNMTLQRSSGHHRVLVLGDSYTWGFGVGQSNLFSAPQVHGTDTELLNLGVSGYGTDQEYLLYLRTGAKFDVDEVTVAFTPYNDVENNLNASQYGYLKPYFTLESGQLVLHANHIHDDWFRRVANVVRRHSRFWDRLGDLNHVLQDTLAKGDKTRGTAKATLACLSEKDITDADRHGVELTVAILKKFQEAVLAHHAKFSVIFVPYKPHIDHRLPYNHPLVPLLAAGLARAGIVYREPYPQFLEAAKHGVHPFNDPDNHFGPSGHALFAKFLLPTKEAAQALNYYEHGSASASAR